MRKSIRHVKIENKESGSVILNRVTNVIFSVIEIVLVFSLIFKILGANPGNSFVNAIYSVTSPIVGLFDGIFKNISLGGDNPERVLEPGTLIAIILFAIIGWIVQSLVYPIIGSRTEQTEYIEPDEHENIN